MDGYRMKVLLIAAVLAAGLPAASAPRVPSAHAVVFHAEAVIAADRARVWNLLVDLDGYAAWNPWVVRAEGQAAPGADVTVDVVLGGHTMKARHTVLTVVPQTEFCWKDAGWNSWFVYGQRCRWLEPRPDGTVLFRQELLLDGALSGAASATMGRSLRDGMAAETAALKQHAER
jgi:uncharacterized protein YndB with AHSA1/START domain